MNLLKLIPDVMIFFILAVNTLNCKSMPVWPASDHYDGNSFHDSNGESDHTFSGMIKWLWEMDTVKWPKWINDPVQPAPPEHIGDGNIRVTYINHATVLIQADGLNILTDPIWSYRAGPVSWLGSKRVRNPGIKIEDLPEIDIILISHDHYDHLDLPTLRQLYTKKNSLIITGLGIKKLLEAENIRNVIELDWWQDYTPEENSTVFTFVPAMHNSGRGLFTSNRTLWGGFVIQAKAGNIYFAGDSGYGEFLQEIEKRFTGFSLTIFPVGSYEKRWFMKNQHMNPDDAVRAHMLLNSKQSVGIHFGTFLEHPEQTIDAHETDLEKALIEHNLPYSAFRILKFGEGMEVN